MSLGVAMLEAGETPSLRAERDPRQEDGFAFRYLRRTSPCSHGVKSHKGSWSRP